MHYFIKPGLVKVRDFTVMVISIPSLSKAMKFSTASTLIWAACGASVFAAQPYSTWMADSVIARKTVLGKDSNGTALMSYEHAVVGRALEMVYNKASHTTYRDYIQVEWTI
jgi:hypothetical protein